MGRLRLTGDFEMPHYYSMFFSDNAMGQKLGLHGGRLSRSRVDGSVEYARSKCNEVYLSQKSLI